MPMPPGSLPQNAPMGGGLLQRLFGGGVPQNAPIPLSFEELLRQERGDRDRAALRWNAQRGGPASTAYAPPAAPPPVSPATTGAIPAAVPPAAAPAATPANPPVPTPRPLNLPDISRNPWETPNTAATTGLPDLQTNPYETMRNMTVRPEQGVVTSESSGGVKGRKGKITDYGSANRGARGKVGPGRKATML